ncbi:GspE/PulE family protein [Herbaspirillum sp. YR522]|uniref:GspE/PulE family protein n=1 Tax=Herbaspirillum sp. YR522 TaxID=1144342 RepID=UPI00026F885A|nr:GspE/PulE family protein [Herbaspirillum sp. YR522]EJN03267.1 type II secretory pathway, ATPase PulE/Tfp pilus assembly pathway, ATPase PilB [Herbaspirillum sp. YR522]
MNAPMAMSPLINPAVLEQARTAAARSKNSILKELEAASGLGPRGLIAAVGGLLKLPVLEVAGMLNMQPAFEILPLAKAMEKHCLVLRSPDSGLVGVLGDPFDIDVQRWLHSRGCTRLCLALEADLQTYLAKQEESVRAVDQLGAPGSDGHRDRKATTVLSFSSVSGAASPAVQLVNSTLYDALRAGASDIHLESTATGMGVKYRIDGVLDHVTTVHGVEEAQRAISRLKVMAELDIAERRVPQDGSFRVESGGRDSDVRVSIMPSIHGEDAVIRILDKQSMTDDAGVLTLDSLGFDTASLATVRMLAHEPYGMLLVTGPTGSGKTTTLYAALAEMHNGRDKIITIEDPVEYQLPGILQIPVKEKKGLTFAKGLRSILRHDPDKIMVGEIRDRETAEIAVQSALTGHLVLTTVHANSVFDVFGRFSHMGVDLYAFLSALNGIWAQRLVRLNCPHCRSAYRPTEQSLARVNLTPADVVGYRFLHGTGCAECRGTGYKGRRAIAEILVLNDAIREMVIEKRPIRQVKEAARENGTRTLREAALELVKAGETTLDEIKRVTLHA